MPRVMSGPGKPQWSRSWSRSGACPTALRTRPGEASRKLAHNRTERLDVRESERASQYVDRRIVDRERFEPPNWNSASGTFAARDVEHCLRRVDADDPMAELGKLCRVTAGAARSIERDSGAMASRMRCTMGCSAAIPGFGPS